MQGQVNTYDSINAIRHSKRIMKKMVVSIDADKTFNNTQHPLE